MKLVQFKIALIVIFLGSTMAGQAAAAPPANKGKVPGPPPEAIAPAEPEEGPPEQKYDSLPVDKSLKNKDSKVRAILREGKFADPQAKSDFEDFYRGYFLSRWSVQDDIRSLPRYRQELSSHFRSATPGEARDDLTGLTLEMLKRLVVGNFHPAVKINATLAIGELNRAEQSAGVAAVPLPAALDVLIKAVDSKLSDGIRAAAMVGILRHASAGITGSDVQKKLSDAMLRLAATDVPGGSALSTRGWMVAQAAETLGALGAVGENNEVFTALAKLVADGKLPLALRCAAADALGHLDYSSANGINPVETAVALGRLAFDACKDGLAKAKDTTRVPFRRRMLCRLDAVQMAIGGDEKSGHKGIVSLAKEPPQQAFVTGLQKTLKDAIDTLDHKTDPRLDLQRTPDPKLEDMKGTITKLQSDLEQLLQKKP
jgi:hypothetical protein